MKSFKYNFILFLSVILTACSSISEPLVTQNIQNKLTETAGLITLESNSTAPATIGFVYYPGGLVDPHAYLQWQDKLVTANPSLKIITVKMPSNLAVFGINSGIDVVKSNPTITNWITGGHSLGGTMAAELVNKYQPWVSFVAWNLTIASLLNTAARRALYQTNVFGAFE